MGKVVLERYNYLAATKIGSIVELEDVCKVLHEETVEETANDAVFIRFFACCVKDVQLVCHPFCFYRLDSAVCDHDGDIVATQPFEYGICE